MVINMLVAARSGVDARLSQENAANSRRIIPLMRPLFRLFLSHLR